MPNSSLTPAEFDRAMEQVVALRTRQEVAERGFALMQEALGFNSPAYLPAIDKLCRRLRQLKWRKQYGPPTTASISQAKANVGKGGEVL